MNATVLQIAGVVPPVSDGVGDAAAKLSRLLRQSGGRAPILTSSDQLAAADVLPRIRTWNWNIATVIRSVVEEVRASLVLLHYPSARYGRSLSLTLVPWLLGVRRTRVVVMVHEYATYSLLGKLRTVLMLIPAWRVLASDTLNVIALKRIPLVRRKVHAFSFGATVEPGGSPALLAERERKDKLREIAFFGLVHSGKGLEHVARAFETDAELASMVRLHIVAGHGAVVKPGDEELRERLRALPHVVDHGEIAPEDLGRVLHGMDALLLPFEDGVSERRSSFMAGMSLGIPVLTTQPRFRLQGLNHGKNVILFPRSSSAAVNIALREFCALERAARVALGAQARKWYMEQYSDVALVTRLVRLLDLDADQVDQ